MNIKEEFYKKSFDDKNRVYYIRILNEITQERLIKNFNKNEFKEIIVLLHKILSSNKKEMNKFIITIRKYDKVVYKDYLPNFINEINKFEKENKKI